MTPKEKAKELFDKFMTPIDGLHKYPMCYDTAKQCALIAVDEILNLPFETESERKYWQEVKKEINLL